MTIPCTTKRTTVIQPIAVDRITFIISEDEIRKWIKEKITDDIGPKGVKLPDSFTINHAIENCDASLEVVFDVRAVE